MSGENKEILEFKWGKKKGRGGKNKEVQFYASFTFDGVEYELFDCVYMWKDAEPEPFVGKIIKIWEDKTSKVKVLWFFKPCEITKYLGEAQADENELFLAAGDGKGLVNVNPLRAIAGKCKVVCTSKDERNPQPSKEELEGADYVFYRIFDVDQLIVSEIMPEKIATIDINFIFNQKEGQQANASLATNISTELLPNKDSPANQLENGDWAYSKEISEDKINAPQRENTGRNGHPGDRDDIDESDNRPFKKPKTENSVNLPKKKDNIDQKLNAQFDGIPVLEKGGHKKEIMPLKIGKEELHKAPKSETRIPDGQSKGKSKIGNRSSPVNSVPPMGRKFDKEELRVGIGKIPTVQNNHSNHDIAVTRRPDADKSRWFKELPWEERMENAHRQGTLVLLENLYPSYTSSDVEELIWLGFKESCTAKMVFCAANPNPFSGQAFVVFKTREVAEKVVLKLEQGCLMLSNGRPLVASIGNPCFPGKETLIGHFAIDKITVQQSREKKEAVSTSHCSQPNSIEYDFAMEWCMLQEKYHNAWQLMQKKHVDDVRKAKTELKTKPQ